LLDIAPTVLWALGVNPPSDLEGRVLSEAFETYADVVSAASAVA